MKKAQVIILTVFSVLSGIALKQAIPPISRHFSVAWSVCLSVVCHNRAPCLNHSTDLYAIWQLHLWHPMAHCVGWGSLTPQENGRLGSNPQPKHAIANCCCHLANRNKELFRLLPNYFAVC